MRYIILAVFFYCLYLFLRFLINVFFKLNRKSRIKSSQDSPKSVPKSKKDLDSIEDAEYEEIKK